MKFLQVFTMCNRRKTNVPETSVIGAVIYTREEKK